MHDDSVEPEWKPPSPERVAARALLLAAVSCRGLIEKNAGDPGAEDLWKRVCVWLRDLEIMDEAEEQETQLLLALLGSLARKACIDATWQSEGMVVLGWALGRLELPRYGEQCEPSDSANALGFLDGRASTPLAAPRLRPETE